MSNIQAPEERLSPSTEAYEGYKKKEKKKNKIEHKRTNKYSEKEIRNIASKQDKLPGQKRTKIVSDFKYPVVIAQFLKNLDFPAHKNTIIQFMLDKEPESIDSSQTREMLSLLQQIQEKYYKNVSEIIDALDLVRRVT
jgi:actin-related protein